MPKQYNKLDINSLKGELLINIREKYVKEISKLLLERNVIPIEYLNEQIRLNNLRHVPISVTQLNPYPIIDDDARMKFIINMISKACTKGTSRLITELCNK
uniref:Uncharacterized protein n=1 Tax=viral metagenome TaxID=1070528 RepID=A0A6C0F0G4_9ZZZZ